MRRRPLVTDAFRFMIGIWRAAALQSKMDMIIRSGFGPMFTILAMFTET